jgi:hypothetical protein
VRQILHVDQAERVVYFTGLGAGRTGSVPAHGVSGQPGRLGLRQGHRRRADHIVTMPDTMEYFIDSTSTVDTPPVFRVGD